MSIVGATSSASLSPSTAADTQRLLKARTVLPDAGSATCPRAIFGLQPDQQRQGDLQSVARPAFAVTSSALAEPPCSSTRCLDNRQSQAQLPRLARERAIGPGTETLSNAGQKIKLIPLATVLDHNLHLRSCCSANGSGQDSPGGGKFHWVLDNKFQTICCRYRSGHLRPDRPGSMAICN